ncbi:K07305 msrB; peptide-methionine (R)-S-oxide reductase [Candidatus Pelagibacterales bacterium]
MKKRKFIKLLTFILLLPFVSLQALAKEINKVIKTNKEWKKILTADQYYILRQEGTEHPYTSPLDNEKRQGEYLCAGCKTALFNSKMKYDSGTGWPSFFEHYPNVIATKLDFKLLLPRTEYHCAVCEGHQGHVFNDGPPPTGKRYCNNGAGLTFVPKV